MLGAVLIGYGGKFKLRIAEGASDSIGAFGHFARGGKQGFALFGKNMFFFAANLINAAAVSIKLRLVLIELFDFVVGNFHDFGSGKCHCAHYGNENRGCFSSEILIFAVAGILIAFAVGVAVKHGKTNLNFVA